MPPAPAPDVTITRSRTPRALAAALVLAALGAASAPAAAQDLPEPGDGFTWERVGDRGIDVDDLAFGPDGTLWAAASGSPMWLDTTAGFPGVWVPTGGYAFVLLPLGGDGPLSPAPDTLLAAIGGSTRRSVDGGLSWAVVHDRGGGGLYEVPEGYPHAGRILTGATSAIAYSTDRGATFTPAVVPGPPGAYAGAYDFTALPPGSPHAGRILAAGRWGVNVSDDGGETFRESALWQAAYYVGYGIDVVERLGLEQGPGGDVGAVMAGRVSGQADARVWASTDDGQTWGPGGGGLHLLESPPYDPEGSVAAVLSLGGSSALVVLGRGTVYRSDDAGATWEAVGRAAGIASGVYALAAVLGPDRRLYVGLSQAGAGEGWVWRTAETHDPPPPVPVEPEPVPEEEAPLGLAVHPNPSRGTATLALSLARPAEVAAAVYDVLGRRVAVLHEGPLAAGRHAFPLDGAEAGLPPGVYVVRVISGSTAVMQTVTLLR